MSIPPASKVLSLHGVISLALTVPWLLLSAQHALSFMLGAAFMALNFWMLMISWGRLLSKKSIALPVSVIVIKWTLFGAICVYLARSKWIEPLPFVLGIGSIAVSSLVVALGSKLTSKA
jgi:hypothetical protein